MQQLQNITLQKESILSDKKKRVYKSVSMFLLFLKNEMINQRMLQTRVFHLSIKAATAWLGKKIGWFWSPHARHCTPVRHCFYFQKMRFHSF